MFCADTLSYFVKGSAEMYPNLKTASQLLVLIFEDWPSLVSYDTEQRTQQLSTNWCIGFPFFWLNFRKKCYTKVFRFHNRITMCHPGLEPGSMQIKPWELWVMMSGQIRFDLALTDSVFKWMDSQTGQSGCVIVFLSFMDFMLSLS